MTETTDRRPREYDEELVRILHESEERDDAEGLPVRIKPAPDDPRPHALDPRVLAAARAKLADPSLQPSGASLLGARWRPEKEARRRSIIEGDVQRSETLVDTGDHRIILYRWAPAGAQGPLPALIYLHGGGFTAGDVTWFRHQMACIAERSGCVVLFPEYRHAPEAPYPGGIEDCLAAIRYVRSHGEELGIDSDRLVIAGDSAGGSLTNACILSMPAHTFRHAFEIYPLVLATSDPDWSYAFYPALEEQAREARSRVDRIKDMAPAISDLYTRDPADAADPLVSALNAEDVSMFPPTTIMTAEFDYLRVQGERFAKKLADAGVEVEAVRYGGVDHGFFDWPGVCPQTEEACEVIAEKLRELKSADDPDRSSAK